MNLKNYTATDTAFWTGRIDDINDVDSYRIHQVIQLLDLADLKTPKMDTSKLNICFLGYCCDEGIKRNLGRLGAKHGPDGIRRKLANLPVSFADNTRIYDAGNLSCEADKMEAIQEQLAIAIEKILDHQLFPIVLGGSHDVAYGHFNGIANYLKKQSADRPKIGIINIDAHFDLRPYDQQGSSGTMFSQIADNCAKDNQPFEYLCLGIQRAGNTKSLFKKADALGAEYVYASEFVTSDHEPILAKIKTFIQNNDYIYLTLCSDVFNSASAPGVSALQPLGLNPNHVLKCITAILQSKKVISFDIAEVSPPLDHDRRTAKLAAIIIDDIIYNLSKMRRSG